MKNISRFSKNKIISAGTQVVLKVSKAIPGGNQYMKPGSVGIILESPSCNEGPYTVQFADENTVKVYLEEFTLRREEVDNQLASITEDLRPYII